MSTPTGGAEKRRGCQPRRPAAPVSPAAAARMECLFRIPICGGFCAPTENPDETCFRHISNEYTLPAGPIFFSRRSWCETCRCCQAFGRVGLPVEDRVRKIAMMCGMTGNLIMLVFCFVACLGATTSGSMLKSTYWATGFAKGEHGFELTSYLGVSMRYDEVTCPGGTEHPGCVEFWQEQGYILEGDILTAEMVWTDESICALTNISSQNVTGEREQVLEACEQCAGVGYAVPTLVLGVFAQIPTAATNCQRSTVFGDVNCQATMGFVSNFVTFALGISSLSSWYGACYVEMPTTVSGFDVEWSLGGGFVLLVIATFFKIVDGLLHFSVSTPQRVETGQEEDIVAYMMLSVPNSDPNKPDKYKYNVEEPSLKPVTLGWS